MARRGIYNVHVYSTSDLPEVEVVRAAESRIPESGELELGRQGIPYYKAGLGFPALDSWLRPLGGLIYVWQLSARCAVIQ